MESTELRQSDPSLSEQIDLIRAESYVMSGFYKSVFKWGREKIMDMTFLKFRKGVLIGLIMSTGVGLSTAMETGNPVMAGWKAWDNFKGFL